MASVKKESEVQRGVYSFLTVPVNREAAPPRPGSRMSKAV